MSHIVRFCNYRFMQGERKNKFCNSHCVGDTIRCSKHIRTYHKESKHTAKHNELNNTTKYNELNITIKHQKEITNYNKTIHFYRLFKSIEFFCKSLKLDVNKISLENYESISMSEAMEKILDIVLQIDYDITVGFSQVVDLTNFKDSLLYSYQENIDMSCIRSVEKIAKEFSELVNNNYKIFDEDFNEKLKVIVLRGIQSINNSISV